MKFRKAILNLAIFGVASSWLESTSVYAFSLYDVEKFFFGSAPPEQLEYLPPKNVASVASNEKQIPPTVSAPNKADLGGFDFSDETLGETSQNIIPIVGNWIIGKDKDNFVLVVDGRNWSQGQPATNIADRARTIYGERYAEFLDNVKAYAYFPYSIINKVADFKEGTISVRFKGINGRIDQAAGIVFGLQPNGDYYVVRANALEDNLVLFQLKQGKRSSVKWIKDTPTPSNTWHDLKIEITGKTVKGFLNGKHYLTHELPSVSTGRIGLWSKADSVVYFDDLKINQETTAQPNAQN